MEKIDMKDTRNGKVMVDRDIANAGYCAYCGYGMEGHNNMHRGHFFKRWLLILLVVFIAFWVGYKLGEIGGFIMADYYSNQGGDMHQNWNSDGYYNRAGMMPMQQVAPTTTPMTVPPTTTTTPTTTPPVR